MPSVQFPKIGALLPKTSARNSRCPKMGAQNVQRFSVGVRKRWFVPYRLTVGGINGFALVFGRRQISVPVLPFSQFTRWQASSRNDSWWLLGSEIRFVSCGAEIGETGP